MTMSDEHGYAEDDGEQDTRDNYDHPDPDDADD